MSTHDGAVDGAEPIRSSSHVRLVALSPRHLPAIHEALSASEDARFWRSRGRYIPSHVLEAFLVADGHQCLVVESANRAIGLVEVYDVNAVDGHGQVGAVSWAPGIATAFTVEALILAMDHWFCSLPLEQLFVQTADRPGRGFRKALERYLEPCGSLPSYLCVDGTRFDVLIFRMTRVRFRELSTTTAYFRSLDVRCATRPRATVA
jgi:hypothetical protein